ncbi:hypothetical protein CTI12_AA092580 [Artemisia annua]|uniref:Uncharacterized protein n=1 Tax=Artemisia annua TaxID=35608 RepID=A0A2U1PZH0_ARTAN|nr:hypothetical protein CTI12_AA092580 [Artemisia annua]
MELMALTVLSSDAEPKISEEIPLDVKYPICDVETNLIGDIGVVFDIKRSDGTTCRYTKLQHMLWVFDREDVCNLWDVYRQKYGKDEYKCMKSNDTIEIADFLMWQSLKVMFNPAMDDHIWREIHGCKLRKWMLYQSCGVHFLDIGTYTL